MSSLPRDDYDGPVLPGQRWRGRGLAGHGNDLATVLRCNGHSVLVVYEGGGRVGGISGRRGTRHKAGKKYGIPLDTFRRNFVLYAQAPGYKPEPELPAPPPRPAPVTAERYFQHRQHAHTVWEGLTGRDLREVTGPALTPALAGDGPPNPLGVLLAAEVALRARRHEGEETTAVPEPTPQTGATTGPAENTPVPQHTVELVEAPKFEPTEAPPVLAEGRLVTVEEALAVSATVPPPDPLDVFLDSGRAVLKSLDEEILSLTARRDKLAGRLAEVEAELDVADRKRAQVDAGIQAASAAALGLGGPHPLRAPAPAPAKPRGERGAFAPQPGRQTQREWVLNRFTGAGRAEVGDLAPAFAKAYGLTTQQAIKNISSIMGYQTKKPDARWPTAVRTGKGTYGVAK